MIEKQHFLHGIKTALACITGFFILQAIHFKMDQWLIITILVVMCAQLNVGGMFQKSYMRLLGTTIGSFIAIATLILFGSSTLTVAIAVTIAGMFFSTLATSTKTYAEAGTLGAVTVAIILIGQHASIYSAIQRFTEISIGIIVAALISQFVFPVHASTRLRETQAKTLKKIKTYYQETFLQPTKAYDHEVYLKQDEEIIKMLITQRELAAQAKRELFGAKFDVNYFNHALWCEREITRCISFMYQSVTSSSHCQQLLAQIPALQQFHQAITENLEKVANCIHNQCAEKIDVLDSTQFITQASSVKNQLDKAEQIKLDAFLFCADILVKRLDQLITATQKLNHTSKLSTPAL